MKPSVHDALKELRREQTQRERVFPRWVAEGRLDQREAARRQACLARAIEIVEAEAMKERLL